MKYLKKAELQERLYREGISPKTVEAVSRLTAETRHKARVRATFQAAWTTFREDGPTILAMVLDFVGLGGPQGTGHCFGFQSGTSSRMGWACGLGSGRWQSGDGPAYRSALEQAITKGTGGDLRIYPKPGVGPGEMVVVLDIPDAEGRRKFKIDLWEVSNTQGGVFDFSYARALVRAAVKAVGGAPYDAPWVFAGPIEDWARLLDIMEAGKKEEEEEEEEEEIQEEAQEEEPAHLMECVDRRKGFWTEEVNNE